MGHNHRFLDAAWRRWLIENLERGCSAEEVIEILRKNGFADRSITDAIGSYIAKKQPPPNAASAIIDVRWQNWLRENLERGCDPQQLLQTLLKEGFSEASIAQMLTAISADDEAGVSSQVQSGLDYAAIANPPLLRRPPNTLQAVEPEVLQLFTLDDFLSEVECDAIVAIANRQLRPSTVTVENGDKYYRTSRTCDLSLLKDPVVITLDTKIAKTLGIRPQ
jgi:prolyl 4-hydroxylase